MLNFKSLSVTRQDAVARIDLNRPDKANCLDAEMWQELKAAFNELDNLKEIRAVILGGQGKHFSTGIDLDFLISVQQTLNPLSEGRKQEFLHDFIVNLQASVNAIENCRKPVLAAIQGFCLGAGVDIAAACDMRFATAVTRFSVKEVDLAIVADLGTLQRLPGIVGQGIARELAFTGRTFKGEEALSMGFVNRLFPNKEEMDRGVMTLALDLAAKSPLALRGIKEIMNYSRDHSMEDGLQFVALRNAAMLLSKDLEEAVRAHFEKRPAQYED